MVSTGIPGGVGEGQEDTLGDVLGSSACISQSQETLLSLVDFQNQVHVCVLWGWCEEETPKRFPLSSPPPNKHADDTSHTPNWTCLIGLLVLGDPMFPKRPADRVPRHAYHLPAPAATCFASLLALAYLSCAICSQRGGPTTPPPAQQWQKCPASAETFFLSVPACLLGRTCLLQRLVLGQQYISQVRSFY